MLTLLSPFFGIAVVYHAIATWLENKQKPPGKLFDVGGYRLHLWHVQSHHPAALQRPTVIIEHSLGGVEGYLLIQTIAELADVCLCDRAGYGMN
ncbi:MAG: hypothetical protein AAF703_03795 [Cyanobacteria bacterium P01_D01_bin.105]